MSGMIPGVGVPHRRRPNHHNHTHPPHTSYDGDHRDTSMQLSQTAIAARQRLEKRLRLLPSRSRNLSPPIGDGKRNPRTESMDDDNSNNKRLSLKLASMMRPWSFPSHRKREFITEST
ncbi:uncharacterized protein LOC133819133 isoform X2 [Humulus lupulus]|uniref:uncharacterized protein LOC133819133 isoform X2 n=1 Tax=Humulus lupulus TaxID=3486 RepID=UPI002B416760|nr:uncharacterized protein LOC133819133 isoform X2 [Humulus lupulus]